ncbi:MAG: carboxypeptidase-like regulatory domain-containing protein [Bacteroidota bacterium]
MKIRGILAICLIGCACIMHAQENIQYLSPDLHGVGFEDFAASVEAQTGIQISYKQEWVDGIIVDLTGDSVEVTSAVKQVLAGSGLHHHFIFPDRLIILPEKIMSSDLSYLTDPGAVTGNGVEEGELTANGGKYLEGTKPERMMQTIVVGSKETGFSRSAARIRGRIRDIDSGEPVIGATMVLTGSGKGSVSDQHGVVTLSVPPGRYGVQFSFIGMATVICQLDVLSDGDFLVEMHPTVIALNEVQIVGNHYRDINSTDVGVERLSMKSVKQIPLFMGENDVIKISRLLPGITSAGEASVGVNVRGGNADQNIFYINRLPVYNTSHMFGFLSAFNSDIVDDFSVYKGNVPVNYGGRLSSVFNIITRKGNQKMFTAHAGISPVSAHATVEGPIKKDVASFLVSGRSSYSDWMLNRMEDPLLRESNANFYDFSGTVYVTPDENNDFNAFYYQSFDRFSYGNISEYEYGNRGGSLVWKHSFSPALTSTVTGAISDYTFANTESHEISQAYRHQYNLRHNEVVGEFSWVPALNHHIDFGTDLVYYSLDRGQVLPAVEQSLRIPVDLGFEKGIEGSLFASDNITLLPWLTLYAGLRYSFYSALGPQEVRIYEEGQPKTEGTVVDTVHYSNNEPISFDSGPEIRAAVNIKTGQNTSFKLSFSQMRQYLFMLSNTVTISPTDQWKLSDAHISPPTGNQYTSGIYHIWPRWGLSGSMELYYKHTNDIVEYRDGASFIGSPFTETSILQGTQKAYGVEFMLQKSSGRLNGWISYAYSRSLVQVKGSNEFETINRGDPYPSSYDRPHVLNLIGSYHVNRRITLSSNVIYMSGRPVTFPTSLYFINDIAYIDYYAKNQFRIPDYFRVDAAMSIEGNLKAHKLFHSSWSINVYNALGRNNPQSIFFEAEEHFLKGFSFSVIGVPVVTVSWNIKMGNYESN